MHAVRESALTDYTVSRMRLFVGIPLADAVARELAAVVGRLRSSESAALRGSDGLRWTEPESWHITLQFLGNSTAEQLECLKARLGEVRSSGGARSFSGS